MKHFLPLILTLATGCSMQFQQARPKLAEKDLAVTPRVVFMGDEITHNWLAGILAQHPMWVDKSSTTLETSASMLARFQADVIDLHPDEVHILCCQGDMNTENSQCAGDPPGNVCDNLGQMVQMAQTAGIKIVLGSITPWGEGPSASQIDPTLSGHWGDIENFNVDLLFYLQPEWLDIVSVADYHGALAVPGTDGYDGLDRGDGYEYQASLTTDGVNPNDAGYLIMTTMAEQAINYFQVGGTKMKSNLIRMTK